MQVAQVSSIEGGKFFAKDPEGNVRELQVGDSINEGEVVFGDSSNGASDKVVVSLSGDVTAQVTANGEQLFDATMSATAHGNEEMSFDVAMVDAFLRIGDIVDVASDLREAEFVSEELDVENEGSEGQDGQNLAEGEEILDEEAAEGNEVEDGEQLNLNFEFRDGNSVNAISDLREQDFVNRSQDTIEEERFESEDENRLDNEYSGTRYSDFTPPPSPTIVQSTPTPPPPPAEPPVSVTPPPSIPPIAPPPPPPAPTTVTLKLFAIDSDGNEVPANSVNEGESAKYIVRAYDGEKEVELSGEVDIDFFDKTATGSETATTTDGSEDFANKTQTVTIGEEFSTESFDDYLADNDENFEVVIKDGTYEGSKGGYDIVEHDDTPVTTTIYDNSKPADSSTPHDPNDTDTHDTETDKEIVTIKLFAADENGEVIKDGSGEYQTANGVSEGEDANYIAYAFKDGETSFNDSTRLDTQTGSVKVSFADGTASGADTLTDNDGTQDFDKNSQTITIGQAFSTTTFNDVVTDDNETYTVSIDDDSYQASSTGGYESVDIDSGSVTTTISDAGSKVFVKIEEVTSEVNEDESLRYKLTIVDENGDEVKVPTGKNVDVDLTYTGNTDNEATKNTDYTSKATVTIAAGASSKEFDIDTIDDYFAEGAEGLKITIDSVDNPDNYFGSILPHTQANGADSDLDTATGLINDNPASIKETIDESSTDDPSSGAYDSDDSVYVKITNNDTAIEGNDLVHTVTLVDKDDNPVTVPVGETITVTITYNPDATDDAADFDGAKTTTVTMTGGNSTATITHTTVDDFVADNNESYTATITDVAQANDTYENVAIHATDDSVTGTITDGITLGTPQDASVDEDGLSDGTNIYKDTKSLDITANGDTYTLAFDKSMDVTDKTSGGEEISYYFSNSDKTLTAKANGEDVFTVELNNNNTYTFTLLKPMDHAEIQGKNDFNIPFDFTVTSNGTISPAQTFNVTVVDSIPNADPKSVEVDEDSSVVIRLADDAFKDGKIIINNGNGDTEYDKDAVIDIFDPNETAKKIGELTNNGDGTLTFEPIDDYSNYNDKPSFTYTVTDLDGDTSTATVEIDVKPIADAPDVTADNVTAYEDASTYDDKDTGNDDEGKNDIPLGLTLPELSKDQTDKNASDKTGDNPERNGYIELKFTNGGNVSDAVLELGDTVEQGGNSIGDDLATISSNNQIIKVAIVDGSGNLDTTYHHSGLDPDTDSGTIVKLTEAEYEALKIVHAEDNDRDIQINIGVTSYEVDDSNEPIAGVSGKKDSANMTVVIKPVTDDISLAWDTATNGSISTTTNTDDTFTFDDVDEDDYFDTPIDLKALLTQTSGYEDDASGDLDGSEKRTYTIEGIPEGSVVTLGGQSATAGANGIATIEFNNTNNKEADPEFSLKLPEFYSGTITDAKITLSVQDKGMKHNGSSENNDDWGDVKTEEVYFDITVNPVANQATLQIKQAFGLEDAGRTGGNTTAVDSTIDDEANGIELNIKVSSDDTDGSETFNVRIDDIPDDGSLYVWNNDSSEWVLVNNSTDLSSYNDLALTNHGDSTWQIIINNFQNDKLPKFIPPHNSDDNYTFKINSKTVDGGNESNWLTSDKDMKVIVKEVADVPVGTELNDSNGYAYEAVENDLDDNGNSFDLKDVYQTPNDLNSYDGDGSETLSVVISNLTEDFGVEGASLIGNGVWTFLADDLDDVKIKTPKNFSGEASFDLKYVTTEDAGDSKTHHTDTVNIFVSPTAEATINATTTANEDVLQKVDFGIAHQNGDTDETLEAIKIKVDDVEGKEFTLYLGSDGNTALADAGLPEDSGYYVLTAAQANNIYAKNTDAHKHGTYTFEVDYTVKDSESDQNTNDTKDGTITYDLTINAVTDAPTVAITTINDSDANVSASGTTVTISAEDSTFSVPVKVTSPDMDGSEKVTEYLITGVPMGVEVVGATYYGYAGSPHNGIWLLDIADVAINDASGHTQNIEFKVNIGADFENRDIKITAYTQDEGADVENDTVEFTIVKDYTAETGTGNPATFTLETQETTIYEDTEFNLGSALKVTGTDGSGSAVITITNLPDGTIVTGADYDYVGDDGKTRYVIIGNGNASDMDTELSQVKITPPENINDSNNTTKSMTFDATIATYDGGTFLDGNGVSVAEHILPKTDDIAIAINTGSTNEDEPHTFAVQLNKGVDDETEIIGGKMYIRFTENYSDAGESATGSLKFGETVLNSTVTFNSKEYFEIDLPNGYTMGDPLTFTFIPGNNRQGSVEIEVAVTQKELHDWDSYSDEGEVITTKTSTITVQPALDTQTDTLTISATKSEDNEVDSKVNMVPIEINLGSDDDSEDIISLILDKVPNGFTLYYGADDSSLKLATNTGVSGSAVFEYINDGDAIDYNKWLIPTEDGLPAKLYLKAPEHYAGDLELDMKLYLQELNLPVEEVNKTVTVSITPEADGLSIDPTLTFGDAFDWVDLKLNANMEDVDGSEKMYLEIDGLDEIAQFRLSDGSSVNATYDSDKWTLEDIEYDQINNIQLLHSHSVETVTVNAWTVENANNDELTPTVDATFKLSLNAVSSSLSLPSGAGIDFDKVDDLSALNGVNEINLGEAGANALENLSLEDVIEMTSNSNDLVIKGDDEDTVTFTDNNWSKTAGTGGDAEYDIYTNSEDNTVTVKVQTEIDDSIV